MSRTCIDRLKSAIAAETKARAKAAEAAALYRYATDENGGWATQGQAHKMAEKAHRLQLRVYKAEAKRQRVARSCYMRGGR